MFDIFMHEILKEWVGLPQHPAFLATAVDAHCKSSTACSVCCMSPALVPLAKTPKLQHKDINHSCMQTSAVCTNITMYTTFSTPSTSSVIFTIVFSSLSIELLIWLSILRCSSWEGSVWQETLTSQPFNQWRVAMNSFYTFSSDIPFFPAEEIYFHFSHIIHWVVGLHLAVFFLENSRILQNSH